ncbi:hypothetical protein EDD86DRAFT_231820 [Gorgonomyces haynaldii]|nr:hypothetical protein EDD86DRAFT_231820 [Gorgonomyces haynaldii]
MEKCTVVDDRKEVQVGTGKALLSKIRGEFFCTSHLCPHYKAPLVKGVLSSDGRVMCPWHGACFRVQTGDIEDAPSVDGLVSFDATPEQLKAGKKVPVCKNKKKEHTAVIIGGGAGGLLCAESLRTEGYPGKIVILSREPYLPVDRPKLSKSIKVDASKIALRTQEDLDKLDIEIQLSTTVTDVNTKEKNVTANGKKIKYDHLVVATGGDPRTLPFPGKDLKNIFVMRDVKDANNPKVVIVGSSFIGMEAASILAKIASVTVIGMEKVPFERVLGTRVGQAMQKLNQHNGINLIMEAVTERYEPSDEDPSSVGYVVLKSGTKIPCDFVILGAGVIPKTDFLKSSGIPIDKDQGVSVDEHLQTNIPDVYCIGDIARYPYHLTGEKCRIEHWSVAQNQGRVVAANIVAKLQQKPLQVFKHIPYFWTVQFGKSIRYVGHATSFDETVVQGSTDMDAEGQGLAFVVYYIRKGKVVAVCSLGKDPVVSHCSELMRLDKMPSASELRAGLDILTIPLDCNPSHSSE